jgi:ERCC4-type nuclease
MEIVIDNRENKVIDLFKSDEYDIKIETLDIGDIIFRNNGQIILIIERKTINDLKASICDGRGKEQKARLLNCGISKDRIFYLIEGNIDKSLSDNISGVPISTLIGSMINTQLRDGIKVYKTISIRETVNFIKRLYEKLIKDGESYFKNEENQSITDSQYCSTLKKKKKENMTPRVWFIAQLSLIPQVTEILAEEIVNIYPSISKLIESYSVLNITDREHMLADITYPLKTGKRRRIGGKISKRIYNFLYDIDE